MIKSHYVNAVTATGSVETFIVTATSGEAAKDEIRMRYALRGEAVTVFLGL